MTSTPSGAVGVTVTASSVSGSVSGFCCGGTEKSLFHERGPEVPEDVCTKPDACHHSAVTSPTTPDSETVPSPLRVSAPDDTGTFVTTVTMTPSGTSATGPAHERKKGVSEREQSRPLIT